MKIAVFSDLHLPAHESPMETRFVQFLQKCREVHKVHEIWFLGDVFDLLVGNFSFWQERHSKFFAELSALKDAGVRCLWFEGNHDFSFGKTLQRFGVETIDEQVIREIPSAKGKTKKVFLAHGDLVNTSDTAYLRWRRATRNKVLRWLLDKAPESFAQHQLLPIAQGLSKVSRMQLRDNHDWLRQLYRDFAQAKFDAGVDGVFLGHNHISDLWVEKQKFYLNLGSWIGEEPHYGLWDTALEDFPKACFS
jgi:UDP-2,3-diacylglucosamine hydrolase